MTTWHRTDAHGTRVTFTYTPDDRGNVTLTREEVEGLMRTGGWELKHPPASTEDLIRDMAALVAAQGFSLDEALRRFPKPRKDPQ